MLAACVHCEAHRGRIEAQRSLNAGGGIVRKVLETGELSSIRRGQGGLGVVCEDVVSGPPKPLMNRGWIVTFPQRPVALSVHVEDAAPKVVEVEIVPCTVHFSPLCDNIVAFLEGKQYIVE
jgi:hypothetical protein